MRRVKLGLLVAMLVALVAVPSSAWAETADTGWEAFAQVYPTYLHPGHGGTVRIGLMNTGEGVSSGQITVTDKLPEGVIAKKAGGVIVKTNKVESGGAWVCEGVGSEEVSCVSTFLEGLPPPRDVGENFRLIEQLGIEVAVREGAREGTFANRVTVSGGGALGMTVVSNVASDPLTVSASEPGFGFSGFDVWSANADGSIATQAGSHPYETTFAFGLNELADGAPAGGEPRDLEVELPPGFFGEPNAVPRCTRAQLDGQVCPADTEVGDDAVLKALPGGGGPAGYLLLPVYNVVPPPGAAAEFALKLFGKPSYIDTWPRGYGNHALVAHIDDIPSVELDENIFTLWGVPPEASHNAARTALGPSQEDTECKEHGCGSDAKPRPLVTLPTSCTGAQPSFTIRAKGTWENEGLRREASIPFHDAQDTASEFTGCSELSFDPSLSVAPETGEADTPAGLGVSVTFPQEELRIPGGLVEATIENSSVTLPEGLVLNPDQAAGLQACTRAQARLAEEGPPGCPLASKVGTVKIKTPLLEGALESELEGNAYVLQQSGGGPGELPNLRSRPPALQLLIVASAPGDGINLKLEANVAPNESTGQLTTTLTETPALPFTSFELQFSGGAQAALATPTQCGLYTTTSDFTPWSSPSTADAFPTSSFQVTSGPGGGPCPSNPLPFSPELIAGSTTDEAGAFTNFTLLLQRGDAQQRIEKLQFKAPQGLSAMLSGVTLCPEPQAQEGTCGGASRIGHTSVASGPGRDPLVLPGPGNPEFPIYLTGPYGGAPFGLSIVTPIVAGPFNLGTIVTRAKVEIDPVTAQITVTTQPLPQIIDGVPTDLRLINSVIDRPGFMFNPTNCNPQEFTGTAWGADPAGQPPTGTTAAVSSHFGIGSCRSLQFKPSIAVSTAGKASKVNGASLSFKIAYPKGAQGSESWMKEMKFEIPKQLPARLTTIQKACLAATFEHNRAACPPASVIGHVLVHTPVLPVPLEGQLYFVSLWWRGVPRRRRGHQRLRDHDRIARPHVHRLKDRRHQRDVRNDPGCAVRIDRSDRPPRAVLRVRSEPPQRQPELLRAETRDARPLQSPERRRNQPERPRRRHRLPQDPHARPEARRRPEGLHKKKNRHARQACEKAARRAYGAKAAKKKRRK